MNIQTEPKRFPSRLNQAFAALEDLLEGRNYTVFLWHYHDPAALPADSLVDILHRILPGPGIVIGGSQETTAEDLLAEVTDAIGHGGDSDYGPLPERIQSERFHQLLAGVGEECRLLGSDARIELFWLKEGHPAYPVFWDFAFALRHEEGCDILIGSASD